MRQKILRSQEDRDLLNRIVGTVSSPVLDECRDVLSDRDCQEPVMTKEQYFKAERYRQFGIFHLLFSNEEQARIKTMSGKDRGLVYRIAQEDRSWFYGTPADQRFELLLAVMKIMGEN